MSRLYSIHGTVYYYSAEVTVPLSPCLVLFSQSPLRSQWPCWSSCGMLGHVTRPGTADAPSPRWHSGKERMTAKREKRETRYALSLAQVALTAGSHSCPSFSLFSASAVATVATSCVPAKQFFPPLFSDSLSLSLSLCLSAASWITPVFSP